MYKQALRLMIKIMGHITQDDSGLYPISTAKYNGKEKTNAVVMTPYGVYHNLPEGSTLLSFSSLCQESNKFVLGQKFSNRFKDLKSGETLFGNPETGSFAHFKEDGSIKVFSASGKEIEITKDFVINVGGNAKITTGGNAKITTGGNVEVIASGSGSLSASNWSISGPVNFTDAVTMQTTLSIAGIDFSGHNHHYTWTDGGGSSDTGGAQ